MTQVGAYTEKNVYKKHVKSVSSLRPGDFKASSLWIQKAFIWLSFCILSPPLTKGAMYSMLSMKSDSFVKYLRSICVNELFSFHIITFSFICNFKGVGKTKYYKILLCF